MEANNSELSLFINQSCLFCTIKILLYVPVAMSLCIDGLLIKEPGNDFCFVFSLPNATGQTRQKAANEVVVCLAVVGETS